MLSQNAKERLQELMIQAVEDKFVAGTSLLVIKDGEEQFYGECGMADLENNRPVKRDTIYRLYSMSKPVTGAAAMLAMERGLFDLLDPVSKFLPGFTGQKVAAEKGSVAACREVQIRDLLSMTSGLLYPGEDTKAGKDSTKVFDKLLKGLYSDHPMTTNEFANRLGKGRLAFQPGEHFAYGTSADVMGAILEVVTGMSLGEFYKKEFFEPLGMEDTGFSVPPQKRERLAQVYETVNTDNNTPEIKRFSLNHLGIVNKMDIISSFESGGAGLVSTVDDYAKFAKMLLNNGNYEGRQILAPGTIRFFTHAQLQPWQQADFLGWAGLEGFSYGNFLRIAKKPGLSPVNIYPGEYGWDGWLGTYFCNDPANHLTIINMMQKRDAGTNCLTRKIKNIIAAELQA